MEPKELLLPSATAVAMDAGTADRLLELRSGDAALLYLCLLRQGGDAASAGRRLGFDAPRLRAAARLLTDAGLLRAAPTEEKPKKPELPAYEDSEILQALQDPASDFRGLCKQTEQQLGRELSAADDRILYGIYDYLGMPPEVISLLVASCIEARRKPDGTPTYLTLRQIEREAYRWHRDGVDSAEAAEEYLRAISARRGRQGELLQVLNIRRPPSVSEQKYIDSWLDMGFGPEAVALAYDKTLLNVGKMKWPYLNNILKSWHGKGLHTIPEIEAGDAPPEHHPAKPSGKQKPPEPGDLARTDREAVAWMKEFLKEENDGV